MTMAPQLDPAILKALSLDASSTTFTRHGGSSFTSTFKLTSKVNGREQLYFIKTAKGKESEVMFTGEHASLNAIHSAVPNLSPKSHATGPLSTTSGSFLATDFLTLSSSTKRSSVSLAQKLSQLHSIPAPIPPGHHNPMFGFPVPTCCGDTLQDNTYRGTWAEFYTKNRLKGVLRAVEARNGGDGRLKGLVLRVAHVVVPKLLAEGHLRSGVDGRGIRPVVVHGDLWGGNWGRGVVSGLGHREEEEEDAVVFDPSCCWGHAEFEFGIMGMLGWPPGLEREYHKLKPKDEPVDEWEDRVELYELYHHLNHYAIFGGGYRDGAVRIMERLIKKYG